VSSQSLEAGKSLLLVLQLLLDKFLNQLFQLALARLRNQRLLEQNLIDESVYISLMSEIEEVN